MARVHIEVRELIVGNQDIVFVAKDSEGRKIGELHISRGSVDWWPRGVRKYAVRRTWMGFDQVMRESRSNVTRRGGRTPARRPREA
jgi:hypothetical protein